VASESLRVQVTDVPPPPVVQPHPEPVMLEPAVKPEGSVSVTVAVPLVAAFPELVTVIVYVPVPPAGKLPVWVLVMVHAGAAAGATGAVSLPVAGFKTPPPEMVAEFVTLAGAFVAMATVSVTFG
jgi:hypothetical protein